MNNENNTNTNTNAGNNSMVFVIQGDINGSFHPVYDAKQEIKERRKHARQTSNMQDTENGKEASQPFTGNLDELQEQIDNMNNCE